MRSRYRQVLPQLCKAIDRGPKKHILGYSMHHFFSSQTSLSSTTNNTLQKLNDRACQSFEKEKYEEAIKLLKDCIDIHTHVSTPSHLDYEQTLKNKAPTLVDLYFKLGKSYEAITDSSNALTAYQAAEKWMNINYKDDNKKMQDHEFLKNKITELKIQINDSMAVLLDPGYVWSRRM